MTEHVRIGERTFPYLPPADPPTLRIHPIGSTEEIEKVHSQLRTCSFYWDLSDQPGDCVWWCSRVLGLKNGPPAAILVRLTQAVSGNRKSAFLVTDMFFLLGPLRPTWRLCLVVFPGPRIEKRASCGNFSSFCRPYVDARTAVRRPFSNLLKWEQH